ncbi:DNA repair protein RecN [Candidatus Terasakiella magnetica]|uniref:DNA repair protein RecN n=1 Tax=Candidatus Terasakiella magnetica TaxID=1867952 RepID=A0A1C3RJE1_9PROT|nr:DNA repair protein RecN [Candidatus Terasakiella magnetica]SCA57400.1 DNA repair protein RecN [Candidatus Terasakiella magnetica]
MLHRLSIRDIVLIDKLNVDFKNGLCVLTGETGAGKSILLDSLGLALGARADSALVRHGSDKGSVSAEFDLPHDHPFWDLLVEADISREDSLVLRRVVNADGRSRAYINDQPVSVSLLKQAGAALVEIHGQFDTQGLLNPITHRGLLDAFGNLTSMASSTKVLFHNWKQLEKERLNAEQALEKARADEEYLRHMVEELTALAPQEGEEEDLASQRQMMMHGEKLLEGLKQAHGELSSHKGVEIMMRNALRHLERIAEKAEGRLDGVIETLDKASEYTAQGIQLLERASNDVDLDPRQLEAIEERLFALRAAARKHDVPVTELPSLKDKFEAQLNAVEAGDSALQALREKEEKARNSYIEFAEKLGDKRRKTAKGMDRAVNDELGPLKLGGATFGTSFHKLEQADWNETGCDKIAFEISTNPGAPLGPIAKVASGGELSRFMLALKVVLAQADPIPTLVFDEVDAGIGGATAAAVGERLGNLAQEVQVLVVTHSPQVGARGNHHLRVSKAENGGKVISTIRPLDDNERTEEIARMISGEQVTTEARAAADTLLNAV